MSKIIKISNKKLVSKSGSEQIERLKKQLLELEEETQTTQNRAIDYAQNKQKIDDTYIMANATRSAVSLLTNRVGTAEQDITNLSSSLSSHVQDYNSLNQRFANVVQVVGQNGNNIMTMDGQITQLQLGKQDKLTAGTGITIDRDNIISASGSSGDVSQLQTQINSINSRISVLETKVNELSPQYNETISKENDTYERNLDISAENEVTTPGVLFAMSEYLTYQNEEDETITEYQKAKLNFTLNFKVDSADTVTFAVYNKSTLLKMVTQTVELADINTSQTIAIKATLSATTKDQNVYVVCTTVSQNTTITLSYMKLSIIGPNVSILNKISPFDVIYCYYTNKYYFSDCTTGYAKLAEIDANSFTSINDLTWTTTNIEAQSYKTYLVPETTDSTVFVRYALIIHKNNTAEIINYNDSNKRYIYPLGTYKLEPFPTRNGYMMINYICVNKNNITAQYNIIQHTMVVTNTINFANMTDLANIAAGRNNLPYISFGSTWVHLLVVKNSGKTQFYVNRQIPIDPEVITNFSQDAKLYMKEYVTNAEMSYRFYFKIFDKYYYQDTEVRGNAITLIDNIAEINNYDDLFVGKNNDLFVVINNQLSYILNQNQ